MRFKRLAVVTICMSSLFLVCSTKREDRARKEGPSRPQTSVFHYRLDGDPPTLDVAHCTDTRSAAVVLKIFDGLVQFDPVTLNVIPAVAKSWEISGNGLVYTFHLRSDALFHNQKPVRARDFEYSFKRLLDPKTASERSWVLTPIKGATAFKKGQAGSIEGIKVENDTTLVLTLEKPFSPFLSQLCMEAASALPETTAHRSETDIAANPIGCGPFRFVSWKRGSHVKLEAFDKFYGKPASVKEIQFDIYPNVETAFQQYMAGRLDFLDQIPQGRIKELQKKLPEDFHQWPVLGIYYYGFNLRRHPFKGNPLLRKAFCHAIDRKKICEVIHEGTATPSRGILPPGIPGHDSLQAGYPYNPEKAKTLLAQAGYPGGKGLPKVPLWFNQNERHQRVAQYVQALLKDIGVSIELKKLEWGTYLQALQEHEPLFYRLGWVADLPDPDNFMHPLLHSSQAAKGDNFAGFENALFDSLVDVARAESDPAKRIDLYRRADRTAMDHAAWLMISYNQDICLLKPKWQGLQLSRQGDFAIPLERLQRKAN